MIKQCWNINAGCCSTEYHLQKASAIILKKVNTETEFDKICLGYSPICLGIFLINFNLIHYEDLNVFSIHNTAYFDTIMLV